MNRIVDGVRRFYAWIKTLPPSVQTTYYAFETAFALALGGFLMHLGASIDDALATPPYAFHFAWITQLRLFELSLAGGCIKAVIDLLKTAFGVGPTQEKA